MQDCNRGSGDVNGGIEHAAEANKRGNFTQMANEMLEYFAARQDLTATEFRLCFFLMRELVGWDYRFKPIEISAFSQGIKAGEKHVINSIKSLIEKGVILKKKVVGYRTPCYGFNESAIGRTHVGETRKVYRKGENIIDLNTFKILKVIEYERSRFGDSDIEGHQIVTQKTRIAATIAACETPKDTLNTPKYNLREISEFLETQKPQIRGRWEAVIQSVLEKYPRDETLLWATIDLVQKTKKDLFGAPIRRSIIALFELDWGIMRVSAEAKFNQLKLETEKKRQSEENKRRYETVKSEPSPLQKMEVDIDKISPLFRKFATRGIQA